ncbi:MAG: hypothetical protein U0X87_13805 [Anaerolineales bacterium]
MRPVGHVADNGLSNVVNEVFLQGNEPVQADNMYRKYAINRETGLLATVFTLPQLIEERVYLVVPSDARAWAESAGVAIPPSSYDVVKAPPTRSRCEHHLPRIVCGGGRRGASQRHGGWRRLRFISRVDRAGTQSARVDSSRRREYCP